MVEQKTINDFGYDESGKGDIICDLEELRKEAIIQINNSISLLSNDKIFKRILPNFMIEIRPEYEETLRDFRLLGSISSFVSFFQITNEDLK